MSVKKYAVANHFLQTYLPPLNKQGISIYYSP